MLSTIEARDSNRSTHWTRQSLMLNIYWWHHLTSIEGQSWSINTPEPSAQMRTCWRSSCFQIRLMCELRTGRCSFYTRMLELRKKRWQRNKHEGRSDGKRKLLKQLQF